MTDAAGTAPFTLDILPGTRRGPFSLSMLGWALNEDVDTTS